MMVSARDRLGEKLHVHLRKAEEFLERLYGEPSGDNAVAAVCSVP